MDPTKRLVCIGPKMLSQELVNVVMALGAAQSSLANEVQSTANNKNLINNGNNTAHNNVSALAVIKKEKDKKRDKERDKKDKDKDGWDLKLDITREFRCTHFPMIYAMLQNPLSELLSNVSPIIILNSSPVKDESVNIVGAPISPKDATGWLFLFNDPTASYSQDGIEWQTAKMSVKLIVANQTTGTYKLKNNRSDEGLVVMRRQTWQGKKAILGKKGDAEENSKSMKTWRKHEYKLVQREKFYKTNPDGSLVVDQLQRIVDFPVLVHYFIKTTDVNRVNRKRKAKDDVDESDDVFEKEELTDSRPPLKVPMLSHHASPATSLVLSQQLDYLPSPHLSFDSTMTSFLDNSFELLPDVEFRLCNFSSVSIPVASPLNITAKVKSYAPEGGAWEDSTKVLLVVDGFPALKNSYSVRFGDIEVPATEVMSGVIEFHAPAHHTPGIAYFWVVCRHGSAPAEYSNPVPFFYYPSDQQGHLRLDFKTFAEDSFDIATSTEQLGTNRQALVNRFKFYVRELDISNNGLDDLEFLCDLSKLQTLIADNNKLTHSSHFPFLPNLKTFSVNYNSISNLEIFLDNIQAAFPNLTYLSLIHNEACPYFSKMAHHYYNYRIYVISRVPSLLYLDSSIVTAEEHRHASCIMTDSLVAL